MRRHRLQGFYLALAHQAKRGLRRYRPQGPTETPFDWLWDVASWALPAGEADLAAGALAGALACCPDLQEDLRVRVNLVALCLQRRQEWPQALPQALEHIRAIRAAAHWLPDQAVGEALAIWAAHRLRFCQTLLNRGRGRHPAGQGTGAPAGHPAHRLRPRRVGAAPAGGQGTPGRPGARSLPV